MSTLKKLLALTLALAMVLSVSVFAGNYSDDTYADAAQINDDCKDAVEVMYALDIMVGDGTNFKPEQAIARKEMAKIIYVIMNGGKDDGAANYKGNSIFSDVPADEWYNGYVNYCAMTKKIQGYNGKFDPDATLTVAAAAKMLLTAIGYDAEAYGFVGTNWENNVLTVAHEAGLLTDVSTLLTGAAQRQWVAKMIMNALGAYCYETIAAIPGNGVLGNYWVNSGNQLNNITTFGKKYLNVDIKTGYLVATSTANLDAAAYGANTFTFGKVAKAGLTSADLGQHFSVVVKLDKDNNMTALSVRNTGKSVVGEALVKDVEYKLTYGTANNNEKNKYEYTVGDLTGKLNVDDDGNIDVQVLTIKYDEDGKVTAVPATSDTQVKGMIAAQGVRNDVVRAIDKDGDGDVDYVINTPVSYAYITKVGTSNKYGDYVNAEWIDGSEIKLGDPANKNLYIDELFIGAEDLAKGNFVKFVWNVDEGMFEVETLEGVKGAKFESRKISKNEYTFAGETYGKADNAFASMENIDGASKLSKKYDIVYDGDLLVYVGEFDASLTDMAEINEQLAVLVSADINNDGISNVRQVELFTIDGEIAWYDYDYTTAKEEDDANVLTWSEIAPNWSTDVDPATWDKLVIVHTNDDGEVYVELVVDPLNIDGCANLVDKVEEIADKTLDVDGGKAKYDGKRVGADAVFFAMVEDEYCVITMSDLEDAKYVNVDATALVKNNTYYKSVVGGYIKVDSTEASAQKGYLVVTNYDELKEDNAYGKVTALINGADAEAEIKVTNDIAFFETNGAYAYYTYEVNSDGKYVLSTLTVDDGKTVTPDEELELWYTVGAGYDSVDFSDYDYFSLKVTTKLQDQNDTSVWETIETTVEFTDAEAIVEFIGECEALEADYDYTYTYNYRYVVDENADLDDLFVMVIDIEMVIN